MSRMFPLSLVLPAVAMATLMGGCSGSGSQPISVSLSPSTPQAIDEGQTLGITAAVTNDSSEGVSWSLTGPGSLSNPTQLFVTYKSSPTVTSAQSAVITATSVKDMTKSASVRITVNPSLQILPLQSLANGEVGAPYSQTIALTGGTAPFQWGVYHASNPVVGGSVPDGLTLDATTGVVSGTPTGAGTWYFEAEVTDARGVIAYDGSLSIQINPSTQAGNPVPFLNQPLVPTSVSPGSNDLTLKVSGTGFVSGATIDFNSTLLKTVFVNSEHLSATVPAAQLANAGTASVTVTNPAPGGGRSNMGYFQVGGSETTVNFVNARNSPVQISGAIALSVADFNEDGKPDLAIAGNTRVYVLLGNGDGTFASASRSPIFVPAPPFDSLPTSMTGPIAVGDFNNSGHPGLAVGEFQNQVAVIYFANGDGTFELSSAAFANGLGQPMSALTTADFNGDGNLDLAITNEFSGLGAPVPLGYGKGAFTAVGSLYAGIFPIGLAVGDFNADGKLDAAVASGGTTAYPGSGVNVSLGNGDGTFTLAGGTGIPLAKNLSAIITGDFNGDGKLDLAVTDYDLNEVIVLLGNGDGTFGAPTAIPVGNHPDAIVASDFNNDGMLDLAIANYGDGTITLLLGNGGGTFTPASGSPYTVGQGPTAIAAADFNGDGKLDLAVTNSMDGTGTVSVLLQQ